MDPLSCSCSMCGVDAGHPCIWPQTPHPQFHSDRLLAAHTGASNTIIPNRIIDAAVDALGLD